MYTYLEKEHCKTVEFLKKYLSVITLSFLIKSQCMLSIKLRVKSILNKKCMYSKGKLLHDFDGSIIPVN